MLNKQHQLVWKCADLVSEQDHVRSLSQQERQCVNRFVETVTFDHYKEIESSQRSRLLGELSELYQDIKHALQVGRGFIVVDGLPGVHDDFDIDRTKILFLELSKYLGSPLIQNRQHDLLFDVKSLAGQSLDQKNSRGPYVKGAIPMHTDAGHILGMYCYANAAMGGDTLLASAEAVHDRIKERDPALLTTLYQTYYTDRRNSGPENCKPYDASSVFADHDGELVCQYHQPFYAGAYEKCPELEPMTETQHRALALFDEVAASEEFAFRIKLDAGSVIFINNEKVLHGRTSFDYPENMNVRHLMRIWLSTPDMPYGFPNFLGYPMPMPQDNFSHY